MSFIVSSCSGSPNNKDDNKRTGTGNFVNSGIQCSPWNKDSDIYSWSKTKICVSSKVLKTTTGEK